EADVVRADAVEHRTYPRHDVLGPALELGVGLPAELEVDAPDTVGLLVQQHALARMKRRVEPEAALGRKIHRVHPDVRDQEPVAKLAALRLEPEQRAQRRARTVAGRHMTGLDRVAAI